MDRFGIDVSHENGKINWYRVSRQGVEFAILRCHQKYGIDEQFKRNYAKCQKYGIPVGVYKYSYAATPKEAKSEASKVLKALKGKNIDLPVFYDLESSSQEHLGKEAIEEIAEAFLKKVSSAGYQVGIYCNRYWYDALISEGLKKRYKFWIAAYAAEDLGLPKTGIMPTGDNVVCWQYSQRGTMDGITGYVDLNLYYDQKPELIPEPVEGLEEEEGKLVEEYDSPRTSAEDILAIARDWIGYSEAAGTHREIVDLYNSHKPLARGYAVQYTDSWCDTFVSACFIKADAVELIGGTECGVENHIQLFKAAGIWTEDGTITPRPGDIICYNWDDFAQPNTGFADHIGLVDSVGEGTFSVIEGNYNDAVGRRSIPVGWGYIRGFARPKYTVKVLTEETEGCSKSIEDLAREVIDGKWGNGPDRVKNLAAAGYDADAVQAKVNDILM